MRRIAAAVGITPMAIYHHFPNRETLLTAIADREFDRFAGALDARRKRGGTTESQLLRALDCYLDYALTRPGIFDYVFSQRRTGARRFPADFRAGKSPSLNRLSTIVTEGMTRGEIGKDDVWEVALEVWAHIHGYVALYRAGRFALPEKEFRQLCRRSLRRLYRGLKP